MPFEWGKVLRSQPPRTSLSQRRRGLEVSRYFDTHIEHLWVGGRRQAGITLLRLEKHGYIWELQCHVLRSRNCRKQAWKFKCTFSLFGYVLDVVNSVDALPCPARSVEFTALQDPCQDRSSLPHSYCGTSLADSWTTKSIIC